jgi:hypothetical protein
MLARAVEGPLLTLQASNLIPLLSATLNPITSIPAHFMRLHRPTHQRRCTFCDKSESDAKVLIASTDKRSHICEECVLKPARLTAVSPQPTDEPAPISPGIFWVFRRTHSGPKLKCSFCNQKVKLPDAHRSAVHAGIQAQICISCLAASREILHQDGWTWDGQLHHSPQPIEVQADFNGLFSELLCISHGDSAPGKDGKPVLLRAGMKLTAYDDDIDDNGNPDDLIASGIVEPSPAWLRRDGSRWVLRIDEHGVRHRSEL